MKKTYGCAHIELYRLVGAESKHHPPLSMFATVV